MHQDVVSFVLRFVREAGEEQEARWRGIVKHVQSNQESHFSQFAEALAFMQDHVNAVIADTAAPAEATGATDPFLETARLWGEMMPRYTQFMLDAVRESMETPFTPSGVNEQMQRALDAALAAWGLPRREAQSAAQADVAALNVELAALRSRLATVEAALRRSQRKADEDDDAADQ